MQQVQPLTGGDICSCPSWQFDLFMDIEGGEGITVVASRDRSSWDDLCLVGDALAYISLEKKMERGNEGYIRSSNLEASAPSPPFQ